MDDKGATTATTKGSTLPPPLHFVAAILMQIKLLTARENFVIWPETFVGCFVGGEKREIFTNFSTPSHAIFCYYVSSPPSPSLAGWLVSPPKTEVN
jgi:hypothetical protein